MFPMDYEEFFMGARRYHNSGSFAKIIYRSKPAGESMNRKLLRDFRLYMLVGGMPQAIDEYIQTNNFRKVDAIKRDILSLYEDDFKKIDATGKLSFYLTPFQHS